MVTRKEGSSLRSAPARVKGNSRCFAYFRFRSSYIGCPQEKTSHLAKVRTCTVVTYLITPWASSRECKTGSSKVTSIRSNFDKAHNSAREDVCRRSTHPTIFLYPGNIGLLRGYTQAVRAVVALDFVALWFTILRLILRGLNIYLTLSAKNEAAGA